MYLHDLPYNKYKYMHRINPCNLCSLLNQISFLVHKNKYINKACWINPMTLTCNTSVLSSRKQWWWAHVFEPNLHDWQVFLYLKLWYVECWFNNSICNYTTIIVWKKCAFIYIKVIVYLLFSELFVLIPTMI